MNKEVLRSQFIRDKEFLRSLYGTNGNIAKAKQILTFASDAELNTLIKFLHCLAKGEIRIKKINFEAVLTNNKLGLIKKTVEKNNSVKLLLNSDRQKKTIFLRKLSPIYQNLLDCLFNE